MNTPKSNINGYSSHKLYPQVETLFQSLNISNQERKDIEKNFYNIAKIVYKNPEGISNDTITKIKLGETHSELFTIQNDYEWNIIGKYFNFIQSYPNGEKIWRTLTAYYNPNQS